MRCEEKSNEITAIPELLRILNLADCIVTIDAMGCQTEIVKQIVGQGTDYVISLKGNQGNLYEDVKDYLDWAERIKFKVIEYDYYETEIEKDHGRIEQRRYNFIFRASIRSVLLFPSYYFRSRFLVAFSLLFFCSVSVFVNFSPFFH